MELSAESGCYYIIAMALCTLVTATTGKNLHVFQEKAKKDPSFLPLSRADKVAIHEVVFAISQLNMEQLIRVLDDVSDPSSSNYGKHWSKAQVAEFTANKKSYNAVMEYLHSKGDATWRFSPVAATCVFRANNNGDKMPRNHDDVGG
eukprot:gene15011-19872_t